MERGLQGVVGGGGVGLSGVPAAALSLGLSRYKGQRGREAVFRPFMEGLGTDREHRMAMA